MRRGGRLLAAFGLVILLTAVPIRQVAACSCAFLDLPQAMAEADAVIVGTLVGAGGSAPIPGTGIADPIAYTWAVERSRDPLDGAQVVISAIPDDGANCGMTFDVDGRWLVLAYRSDAGLETNGCMRNVRLADAGPDDLEAIDAMVATPPDAAAGSGIALPGPVVVGGLAVALLVLVSALAFRRPERD